MARDDGRKSPFKRPGFIVLAAVGLLLIAAAATPEGWALLDAQRPRRIVMPDPPAIFGYTLFVIGIATAVAALVAKTRAVRQGLVERRKRSLLSTLLVLALLLSLWATSPRLRDWIQERFGGGDRQTGEVAQQNADDSAAQDPQHEPSAVYGFAITLVLFLLLAAGSVAALWLFRRDDPEALGDDVGPELMREIERGLDDLNEIDDPRAAVIACYARMETVSAASGVAPRPSDTPFEHLGRLLERHSVAEDSARRLTELFERAKFSNRLVDESTRREALAALEDIRGQLGATV
jgi:hypothetical protein